ncbi:class I adenylate-forming enzyme family protein [Saccharomonospora halophila]|uniref:class I adenylate-forming enzyme family protein n=1 Tax=Saccharomonospora halophila TaxID=129922 RepID=UPI00037C872C|nr:class I adenylate-forming enzyme family protein [Saccharomonospora halophila]
MTASGPQAAQEIVARLTGPGGAFEMTVDDVLGARLPVFVRRARSLGEVLSASLRYGDADYLVTEHDRLSFAEHGAAVASLARELRTGYGVGPGDRVGIMAANSPGWVIAFWATVSLGAVAVGYNAWWSPRETGHALGLTTPTVVVADHERAPALREAGVTVLSMEDDLPGLTRRHPDAPLPDVPVAEDDPAVILFTSGTSGMAKAVVHTHRNLTSVIEYHRFNDALARAFGDPTDSTARRYLLAMPLFHIASLHNLAVPRLATGSAVVMNLGRFEADRVLRLIESERVTNWGAVPTMAHRLMEHGDLASYDLSSLTAFSLASAPSSPEFKQRLRETLPFAKNSLVDSYGLTESATAITVATPADLEQAPGTLGRPVIGVEVRIRDETGAVLPPGQEGEVCTRSAYTMAGYFHDPEATAKTIDPDRWLHTGDIGMLDEQGRLRLASRRSDLILRGGENVYPTEVEYVLDEHPAVAECVVLGVDHPDLGQEVGAVVVTRDGAAVTERELTEFCRQRLAHFKVPDHWRLTTSALPRNATGKIIRKNVAV